MNSVAVIDYGMGNLHSVAKAFEYVGDNLKVQVSSDEKIIRNADRVVFPGVGAMRDCMAEIKRLGVDDILRRLVEEKPVLAICVGMQALMEFSEENDGVDCIGIIPGRVNAFADPLLDSDGELLKVPHMGWNNVYQTLDHSMWKDIPDESRFYFVHGFYVNIESGAKIAGDTDYPKTFTSALVRKNIFGVQFHPEKSQTCGLQLLKNFIDWDGEP